MLNLNLCDILSNVQDMHLLYSNSVSWYIVTKFIGYASLYDSIFLNSQLYKVTQIGQIAT